MSCATGAWAQAAPAASPAADGERPPDVLLILLDDVNDWVGHLGGHPGAYTPAMDRLAQAGVAFTNAHCSVPVCNASRTSMLGGVRPAVGGVGPYANGEWIKGMQGALMLPEYFEQHGYSVAIAGKVFHDGTRAAESWEHFAQEHDEQAPPALEEPRVELDFPAMWKDELMDWGVLEGPESQMPDHRIATWASERLQRDDEAPLFLAVGLATPHLPWFSTPESFAQHPLEEVQLPEVRRNDRNDLPRAAKNLALQRGVHDKLAKDGLWRGAVQAYLAATTYADSQVGRLLEALERSPRADRTIVVLTSDHGYHLGEKLHWRKFTLWEEATHVPLVISVPGRAASRCARPVDLQALYPTLCGLAGLPVPEHVAGVDLGPLLADPQASWEHAAFTSYKGHRAIRTEHWRYILYANGDEELYDHERDPGEFKNLAGLRDHRDVRAELHARLLELSGD